jgi:hypothetical protein
MEDEVLQSVLVEVLEELREVKQQQAETARILTDFKEKAATLQPSTINAKTETFSVQTEKVTAVINNRLNEIKQLIEAQPRPVIKQVRILFFPEYGAREYFKTVSKLTLWLLAVIISSYFFVVSKEFIKTYSYKYENELATSKYRAAWNNLYRTSKRGVRQKMNSV